MGNEIGNLDVELIKYLYNMDLKIIIKFSDIGGEIYVEKKK